MRRYAAAADAVVRSRGLFFSTTVSRLSSSSSSPDAAHPQLLTQSQVEHFHREGYVIVENAVQQAQLEYLGHVVRDAAKKRGTRFVPESDKQHRPNAVQFEATLHEAMPAEERHRLGANGQHEATFERREKRIKIQCRNRKEMERAYKKIVTMRQQYSAYKGVDLAPKAPGNLDKKNVDASESRIKPSTIPPPADYPRYADPSTQQGGPSSADPTQSQGFSARGAAEQEQKQKEQHGANGEQSFVKVKPQSRQETNSQGFSQNADDDVDVHAFNKERARETFDKYRNSGQMETDIRKGNHIDDAFAHIYNGGQTWMQVCSLNAKLRDAVFNRKVEDLTTKDLKFFADWSIAAKVGAIGAQLAGVMTTRLYTDTIIQRTPFCNSLPFHHDSSGINYRDPRGLQATIVLAGSAQPLDTHHGGYVVLPGSHAAIKKITNDCRDQTGFVRPAAWETGESLRAYPQLLSIEPRALGELKPGTILFMSNMLVYANGPNMAVAASEAGRKTLYSNAYKQAMVAQAKPSVEDGSTHDTPAPPAMRAELFLEEAPITYSLSIMPDGVCFDGVRNTWMAKDTHGPLHKMEAGQPLRDPALFPVLYSEIPDTL